MFSSHPPIFLIDTVLEGRLGTVLVDDVHESQVAMLQHADVVVLGGRWQAPAAAALVKDIPCEKGLLRMPEPWTALVQQILGEELIAVERIPFFSQTLDSNHCRTLKGKLPRGFDTRRLDQDLAVQIWNDPDLISEDHVRMYASPHEFVEQGDRILHS